MSPILVRPVREQLEHDRVIRLLQAKLRRKYEVGINVGDEKGFPVRVGNNFGFPDVVLMAQNRGRRIEGLIEVETGESVNHLEALAEWAPFSHVKAAFHLYVPSGSVDVTRRLCTDYKVEVDEIWSYHTIGDQMRFTLVHRAPAQKAAPRPRATPAREAAAGRKPVARAAKKRARPKPAPLSGKGSSKRR